MTSNKVKVSLASAVALAGVTFLAWNLWSRWEPAKLSKPPLVLSGTWTPLDKPQPLGHIVSGGCFALDPDGQLCVQEPNGLGIQKRDRDGRWG